MGSHGPESCKDFNATGIQKNNLLFSCSLSFCKTKVADQKRFLQAVHFAEIKKSRETVLKEEDGLSIAYTRKGPPLCNGQEAAVVVEDKKTRKMKLGNGEENKEVFSVDEGNQWKTLVY